jgi:ABC-type dipeptide/oligopeptide/nickel transport system permease subunit
VTSMVSGAVPTEGRVSRVVIFGLLAAGWGADLFEDVSDLWLTVPRFLLMIAATLVLGWELTSQARRGAGEPATCWVGSDTAIVCVLGGFAALLVAAMSFAHPPLHERTSGTAFIALFLALGGYYTWSRRRTVAREQDRSGTGAGLT